MYVSEHKAIPDHPFRTILAYNRPYWWDYLRGALLAVVFGLVGLAMPLVIRAVVSRLEDGTMSTSSLLLYFSLLLAIASRREKYSSNEEVLIVPSSNRLTTARITSGMASPTSPKTTASSAPLR